MKILKTPEQHAEALERIGLLAARGEQLTPSQQDELEVLLVLTEKYENDTQPVPPPTPLEAIKFRMEQMGYKQNDLAALVGGASRASEIMTEKRGLTTEMIRRLRDEWGIPADSLLGGKRPDPDPSAPDPGADGARDPQKYPMKQMYDRGYFPGRVRDWKKHRKDLAGLLQSLYRGGSGVRRELALCRQGGGEKSKISPEALDAWQQRVLNRAAEEKKHLPGYDATALDGNFLRWLAGLSSLPEGPRLACEALEANQPIRATLDWDEAKDFTRSVAELMVRTFPDKFVATITKAKRHGKILIDYFRNAREATAVGPYTVRTRANAPVAMPLHWSELDQDVRTDYFNVGHARERRASLK